jgi:serine/threonine protein kinase
MISFSRKGKYGTKYIYSFDKKEIPSNFYIEEQNILGIGNFGVVLTGQLKKSRNFSKPIAIKLIPLDIILPDENYIGIKTDGFGNICETEDFLTEVEIATTTSKNGITPKVFYSKIVDCKKYECQPQSSLSLKKPDKIGILIMEQFGISLEKYILEEYDEFMLIQNDILEKIIQLIDQMNQIPNMHRFNIVSDLHYGNILIDPESKNIKLLDLYYPRHSDSDCFISLEEMIETFKNKWKDALQYAESLKKK